MSKKKKIRNKRLTIRPQTRPQSPPNRSEPLPPPIPVAQPPIATTTRALQDPVPSTSRNSAVQRSERISAAERIHRNRGYQDSVKELLRRHSKLTEYTPAESNRDVIRFARGLRSGVLIQTHVRFRFDYKEIQKHLLKVFARLFALQGDSRDAFEVIITFNAILYCKDTNTYSIFYGTDHRENNRMGAANELGFGGTYLINNLAEVADKLPCVFEMQDLLDLHKNAFPHSNVSVFKMINIIYLIYQFRR